MDDYLDKIVTIIECNLDNVFNTRSKSGMIWDYKTERLDDNNIIIVIQDNKMKPHKYKINIEEVKSK